MNTEPTTHDRIRELADRTVRAAPFVAVLAFGGLTSEATSAQAQDISSAAVILDAPAGTGVDHLGSPGLVLADSSTRTPLPKPSNTLPGDSAPGHDAPRPQSTDTDNTRVPAAYVPSRAPLPKPVIVLAGDAPSRPVLEKPVLVLPGDPNAPHQPAPSQPADPNSGQPPAQAPGESSGSGASGGSQTTTGQPRAGTEPDPAAVPNPDPAPAPKPEAPANPEALSPIRQSIVKITGEELALWQSGQLKPGIDGYAKYSRGVQELWCEDTVWWIWDKAGYQFSEHLNAVRFMKQMGIDKGTYHPSGSYVPKPGDAAIHQGPHVSHVNIVYQVNSNSMVLVGGDQGPAINDSYPNGSQLNSYTVDGFTGDDIVGYVSPE